MIFLVFSWSLFWKFVILRRRYAVAHAWAAGGLSLLKETFSNVCHCGLRISQIPNPTAGRWQPKRLRVMRFYIPYFILYRILGVSAWASCVVYPVLEGNARACSPRMDIEQTPAPFLWTTVIIRNFYEAADFGVSIGKKLIDKL